MIPFSSLIEAVRKAADDYPERISGRAEYRHTNGRPICIVGHAFHSLGVKIPFEQNGTKVFRLDFDQLGIGKPSRPGQLEWLDSVQEWQDANINWRDSIDKADDEWGIPS